jgi:hypothetical protein
MYKETAARMAVLFLVPPSTIRIGPPEILMKAVTIYQNNSPIANGYLTRKFE